MSNTFFDSIPLGKNVIAGSKPTGEPIGYYVKRNTQIEALDGHMKYIGVYDSITDQTFDERHQFVGRGMLLGTLFR